MNVYKHILDRLKQGRKLFAVLVDPQDCSEQHLSSLIKKAEEAHVDLFLVGGSLAESGLIQKTLALLSSQSGIPVLLFPGNENQLHDECDGILLLSLISGRNSEYLIGKHVASAMKLDSLDVQIIPTGYMLIESGNTTAVHYMTQTLPIPRQKTDIAVATALAGQQLGLKMIYLEAGSGAVHPVSSEMIEAVKKKVSIPIFVGGGIKSVAEAEAAVEAGADIVVIGNALEDNLDKIFDFSTAIHAIKTPWKDA